MLVCRFLLPDKGFGFVQGEVCHGLEAFELGVRDLIDYGD